MYILLTGAYKNAGDFLIGQRAKALLKEYRKDRRLFEINRLEKLDNYLDVINHAKAIILCGGPAYQADFYPNIYPLTNNINDIKVPIIPMGLGFNSSGGKIDNFKFTNTSQLFLRDIHRKAMYSSCRDVLTEKILHNHGIENVLMTGCPAWYDLSSRGKEFTRPNRVEKIAFSTGAHSKLFKENVEIMRRLKDSFPKAQLYSVFHRGTGSDKFTGSLEGLFLTRLAKKSKEFGFEVIDASYGTEKLSIYEEVDMHVGFRVHAHIYALSIRKPSFLIQEDGRGCGVSTSLNLSNDLWGYQENLSGKVLNNIINEVESGYLGFQDIGHRIDEKHEVMVKFLKSLP